MSATARALVRRLPEGVRVRMRPVVARARALDPRRRSAPDAPPSPPAPEAPAAPRDVWFEEHVRAADEVIEFCRSAGVVLEGACLGDVGTGDGIIDLALAVRARPASLVGWDVNPVDTGALLERARSAGLCDELPAELSFVQSAPTGLPCPDDALDGVITWSAYEHIGDIRAISAEIARVLRPGGFVFAQVWPLYHSEHGGHLQEWYPSGFPHLVEDDADIRARMDASDSDPGWVDYMWGEYLTLNRVRLDDVQDAFLSAGLVPRLSEIYSHRVHLPESAALEHRLSDLMIAGFKLLLTARD